MTDIISAVLADEEYQRTRARLEYVRQLYDVTDERRYRIEAVRLEHELRALFARIQRRLSRQGDN